MNTLEKKLYNKLVIKYQNAECNCDNERQCSSCRNGGFNAFAKQEILNTASFATFEEFEAMATIYKKIRNK